MPFTLDFTTKFDLDSESLTFGKLVFEDISDYAGAGLDPADTEGIFNIISPLGVYYAGTFTSPDIDGAVSLVFDTLDIPLVSNLQYLLGGYTFTYSIRNDGVDYSTAYTYNFCPPTTIVDANGYIQDACEIHEINSICSKLTIHNTTQYGAYTTLTQSIELSPPALTSLPDVSANSNTLEYTYYWVNVAYSIFINSLATYVSGNVTVAVRVDLSFTVSVSPAKLAAQLMKCFVGFVNFFTAQAALKGGTYNLSPVLQSDFMVVIGYINAFDKATQIADWYTAEALIPKIEAIINQYYNCNCGCDTTKPQFVDPYCGCDGSGSGSDLNFAATYPLVVDASGGTIRYYLDPTWLATIGDLELITIESSDASVSVGSSPNYDLSVKNSLGFTASIVYTAGNDYSVTVSNVQRQGTRYISGFPAVVADFQSYGYPHANIAALKGDYCVFYVKNFLTTPTGSDISDKLDVSEIQILNAGASATDFSQISNYRLELFSKTTTGFYFRLVDADSGLPVTNEIILDTVASIKVTIKINQ